MNVKQVKAIVQHEDGRHVWADFDLTINEYNVVAALAQKAYDNRNHKAIDVGGAVKLEFIQLGGVR